MIETTNTEPATIPAAARASLLGRIEQHFAPDRLRSVAVPEWGAAEADGGEGVPFTIWHKPVNLDDLVKMNRAGPTQYEKTVWLVLNKSLDGNGVKLFATDRSTDEGKADFVTLSERADPYVLQRIALGMLANVTAA